MKSKAIYFEIKTLGVFEIKKNNSLLSTGKTKNSNAWDALKLMLTFKDKLFSPEDLIDRIYSETHSNDPKALLRKQMQRLRDMLLDKDEDSPILLDQGVYKWNPNVIVTVDAHYFESLVEQANEMTKIDPQKALSLYLEAFDLYNGDYLHDCMQLWVYGVRNHYRILFMDAVYKSILLLKEISDYESILKITEKAIQIDLYEEKFHMYYIESLYMLGNRKTALEHYQKITSHLHTTYNLNPSRDLLALYKRIMQDASNEAKDQISISEPDFAYFCSYDVLLSICDLEKRRSLRSGEPATLGSLKLISSLSSEKSEMELTHTLQRHLLRNLRKSDCMAQKDDFELYILLPNTTEETWISVISKHLNTFEYGTFFKIQNTSTL